MPIRPVDDRWQTQQGEKLRECQPTAHCGLSPPSGLHSCPQGRCTRLSMHSCHMAAPVSTAARRLFCSVNEHVFKIKVEFTQHKRNHCVCTVWWHLSPSCSAAVTSAHFSNGSISPNPSPCASSGQPQVCFLSLCSDLFRMFPTKGNPPSVAFWAQRLSPSVRFSRVTHVVALVMTLLLEAGGCFVDICPRWPPFPPPTDVEVGCRVFLGACDSLDAV